MLQIINNPNNLTTDDLSSTVNKVRAIIIDDNNNIILTKYSDIYMLPGGKIDNGEDEYRALLRELKEEVGIDINKDFISPLLIIENYLKDYPERKTNILTNRRTKTTYFVIEYNYNIDVLNRNLTESEKSENFDVFKINLDNVLELLINHKSTNLRNDYFKNELIQVIEEYKKTIKTKVR